MNRAAPRRQSMWRSLTRNEARASGPGCASTLPPASGACPRRPGGTRSSRRPRPRSAGRPTAPVSHRRWPAHGRQRRPGRTGVVPQHVCVELAPGQLGPERGHVPRSAQPGQHLARVDGPEAQVGREPGGPLPVGAVPILGIVAGPVRRGNAGPRRRRPPLRGPGAPGRPARHRCRPGPRRTGRTATAPRPAWRRVAGQPWSTQPRRNGVNTLYGVPAAVQDPPRGHRIRGADTGQRATGPGQGPRHCLVATSPVGGAVTGGVHGVGAHFGGELGHHGRGRPPTQGERTLDPVVEGGEGAGQERPPVGARPRQQRSVGHEEGRHPPPGGDRVVHCGQQSRVVGGAEVAPEPDHRGTTSAVGHLRRPGPSAPIAGDGRGGPPWPRWPAR